MIISKKFISHLVQVKDFNDETSILQFVPIMNKFSNVLSKDLPKIAPEKGINFGIDLLSDTQAISIPSYQMALARLKKFPQDMLKACVVVFKGNQYHPFPLIEFVYNKLYHSCIQMAPLEALYGRRYRSPTRSLDVGRVALIEIKSIHEKV